MIKYIPIEHEEAVEACRLYHEYNAYKGIIRRLNILNISSELKITYKLKYFDALLKRDLFNKHFCAKYLNPEDTLDFRIDIANDLLIYGE